MKRQILRILIVRNNVYTTDEADKEFYNVSKRKTLLLELINLFGSRRKEIDLVRHWFHFKK